MIGTLSIFGYPNTTATLEVIPRSIRWRAFRAFLYAGGGLVLAPALGLIPPHAPWALAALAVGGFMAVRRWRERFTLESLQGRCPKCGGSLRLQGRVPLRPVMTVPCSSCNHESRLTTEIEPTQAQTGDTA